LKETEPVPKEVAEVEHVERRRVTAKHPGEVWHIDLTTVPTAAGFWVPWLPFALPQSWPFCWWVAVVVDHFSRAVVGLAVFFGRPTSQEIQKSLDLAVRRGGHRPDTSSPTRVGSFGAIPSDDGVVTGLFVPGSVPSESMEASPLSSGSYTP
jgi:transposase InsO family protein